MSDDPRRVVRTGDLVAVALAPGRGWLPILRAALEVGAAVLPVDIRLSTRERNALLAIARPTVSIGVEGVRRSRGMPADPSTALVVATSGTSGRPRLAELPRSAMTSAINASAAAIGAGAGDPWLSTLPPAHIGGLLVLYRHLLIGAPIVFRRRVTPAALSAVPHVRFTSMVPTQLTRLLDAGADLRRFRAILVGGSGVSSALLTRAAGAGVHVVPTYGMTETCGGVVYAGRPLAGVEVRASNAGELEIRGATLMRGYRLDPDATATALDSDGWLHTGDGGEVTSDGTVRVWGRLADVIVSGAEKIWPAEVETALAAHPDVAAVLVTSSPDREWGQRVVARVVPRRPAAPPSLSALRSFAAESIARYKLPRELVLVDRLDSTALGKIRRG